MSRSSALPPALAVFAALVFVAPSMHAQEHDHSWLDRCRDQSQSDDRARYCEERMVGMHAGGGELTVDGGENGGAGVSGWDRDSIDVVARVETQARSVDDARDLARRITISTSNGTIRADGPPSRHGASWSVSFDVLVPHASNLRITTHNGPIAVSSVRGHMDLSAVNGPLSLNDAGGDVRGRTENGPLTVRLSGAKWDGVGLDAETTNGPVEIRIPASYSAHLEAGTENGPMSVGFPITAQGRIGRHISSDLGAGGATVRAVTTNGPLVISRRE